MPSASLGSRRLPGERLNPELLAAVAGLPEGDLEGPLREAVGAQILSTQVAPRGDAYRFRHALLAEAVYDDLLPSERRRLHAAYAAALEPMRVPAGADGASHLATLAHHATAAQDQRLALRSWVRAARAAAETHAFGEAARALEHAIELWDAVPADDRPTDTDAAGLISRLRSPRWSAARAIVPLDFARAAIERIDRHRDSERWVAADERLARALWIAGAMTEGLAILEIDGRRPRSIGADPDPRPDRRGARGRVHAPRRSPPRDRDRGAVDQDRSRDRESDRRSTRRQHARRQHRPAWSMRGGRDDPARGGGDDEGAR